MHGLPQVFGEPGVSRVQLAGGIRQQRYDARHFPLAIRELAGHDDPLLFDQRRDLGANGAHVLRRLGIAKFPGAAGGVFCEADACGEVDRREAFRRGVDDAVDQMQVIFTATKYIIMFIFIMLWTLPHLFK